MEEEEEFEEFEDDEEDEFDEPEEPVPVKKKRPVVKEKDEEADEAESKAKPKTKVGRPKAPEEEHQVSGEEIVGAIQNHEQRLTAMESALFRLRGAI